MSLLDSIDSPADLKRLSMTDLQQVADELRAYIIEVVTTIGAILGRVLVQTS